MATTIKLAYHNKAKQIIHIDKADNGLSCDCNCEECGEQLEARQGKVRDWHFKHNQNIKCSGGIETALHKLGKQILVDNTEICLPRHNIISYSDAVAEKKFETKRPDVTAVFENEKIFFEILVSHAVDSDKEKMFVDGQHKSVEIDLRKCTSSTFEEIKRFVLESTNNKRLIFWEPESILDTKTEPETQTIKKQPEHWYKSILYLAITVLLFFGLRSLFNCKRQR